MTVGLDVGIFTNMSAALLMRERIVFGEDAFVELVLWELNEPMSGSTHSFKYRLAFVLRGECVLRYDNESGKGDHRDRRNRQTRLVFESPQRLIEDFLGEARRIHREDRRP